ncbi:MAG: right-handed parallel beta-helix repeat-containing protein [Ignavibacteriales bacterium]|nr:right-handed parallel beta-helix repeat-containing protein [Ignavibacteriales bacterium]
MKKILYFFILILISNSWAQIFVASDGDDNNPGTINLPLKSIQTAVNRIQLGDTIYVRGGNYTLSDNDKISISKNGDESSKYYLFAYNGERPILDFSSMTITGSNRAITLNGSFWHLKGIDIKGAGDNGMNIGGSNNIIEYCSFYENHDTGLQLSSGASNNQIINCDSYFNSDPSQGNADGFAPKLNVGTNNYFYGCRAWQNSDDGWDGYLRPSNDISTTVENCWCFANGYLSNGSPSSGNGNGYKMGGSDNKDLMHNFTLKNCVAFDNRVKGFDQNNNKGSMTLYNCSAYRNGTNYSITTNLDSSKTATLINNVSIGNYGSLAGFVIQQSNSWLSPFIVTNEDFISIDTLGVRGPRNADGSLPDLQFMHLASGSDLIDAGVPVGLPFNGSAPDLGAYETAGIPNSINFEIRPINEFKLNQNYPNPFNPNTKFIFEIPNAGNVTLEIYNILGNKVAEVFNNYLTSGQFESNWVAADGNGNILSSGIYFARLHFQGMNQTIKLILLK